MSKINYKIYATPNGLEAHEMTIKGEYISKVGRQAIEYVRGEGNENRQIRAVDSFLKKQYHKAAKIGRTNLEVFKSALNIDVFEALESGGYITFAKECPPFAVYPSYKI